MKLICVDLELTQPNSKIIQIGATCFDPVTGKVHDLFDQYVNPGEPISEEISILTGIYDEDVAGSPNIVQAAKDFTEFKNKNQANPVAVVWGAGLSNDVKRIYDEAGIDSPFRTRILDVKGVFNMLANASTSEFKSKIGLEKALNLVGLDWFEVYGPPHNAFADAYNTMRLYMFLSKCLKGAVSIKLG